MTRCGRSVIIKCLNRRQLVHVYWCSTSGTDHFRIAGFLDFDDSKNTKNMEKYTDQSRVCNKVFTGKSHLDKHKRTHSGEKPCLCTVCNKSFTAKRTLDLHIRTHTGEKPYQCQLCSKKFTNNSTLQWHLTTHSGEKPHHCVKCGKSFAQKENLQMHMRIHTGEKLHQCSVQNATKFLYK